MVETELSERLQISRGTLREAMRQLQQEGLLTAGATRGRLYVRHLGPRESGEIYAYGRHSRPWPHEGWRSGMTEPKQPRSCAAYSAP